MLHVRVFLLSSYSCLTALFRTALEILRGTCVNIPSPQPVWICTIARMRRLKTCGGKGGLVVVSVVMDNDAMGWNKNASASHRSMAMPVSTQRKQRATLPKTTKTMKTTPILVRMVAIANWKSIGPTPFAFAPSHMEATFVKWRICQWCWTCRCMIIQVPMLPFHKSGSVASPQGPAKVLGANPILQIDRSDSKQQNRPTQSNRDAITTRTDRIQSMERTCKYCKRIGEYQLER